MASCTAEDALQDAGTVPAAGCPRRACPRGGTMPHAGRSCCREGALRSDGRDPLAGHTKPGATRLRAASRSGSCGRRWHGIARGHPVRARMGPSRPGLSPGESRPIPDVRCPQADVRGIGGGQRRAARYAMHGSAAGVGGGSGRVAADACPETGGQTPGGQPRSWSATLAAEGWPQIVAARGLANARDAQVLAGEVDRPRPGQHSPVPPHPAPSRPVAGRRERRPHRTWTPGLPGPA